MKKWRCTVCGYIHEGENPPERCPICGSPASAFVPMDVPTQVPENKAGGEVGDEADIIVVGSGAAAFSAAITARISGAEVLMLEKADTIGGTTLRSGGGFWTPCNHYQREAGLEDNPTDCIRYMARHSYPHMYDPSSIHLGLPRNEYQLIETYCAKASEMLDFMERHEVLRCMMEINWKGLAQVDYMNHLPENKSIRGRVLYTRTEDGKQGMGLELIRQFRNYADKAGIRIATGHRVSKIYTNDAGEVVGVEAETAQGKRSFRARKAVIFGSGGYSHNADYMLQFQRGPHYGGCSVPTNTGDFICMGGEIGARIGNMAGAFRAQSMIDAYIAEPSGSSNVFYIAGDSVLIVNKFGKRIMNEKRNYSDRTMLHFVWDPVRAEWTNLIVFMLFDERTARLWQGFPPYPVQGTQKPRFILEADSLEELTERIEERLREHARHTGGFRLDESFMAGVRETVERYNGFARAGKDLDFQRGETEYDQEWTTFPPTTGAEEWPPEGTKNYTMYPLSETGKVYAVLLAAGTLDTNGGPMIQPNGQVVGWNGQPIPGLYGAGNCISSPTANAYWGAGSTLGPAMTYGYLAGLHAYMEPVKETGNQAEPATAGF